MHEPVHGYHLYRGSCQEKSPDLSETISKDTSVCTGCQVRLFSRASITHEQGYGAASPAVYDGTGISWNSVGSTPLSSARGWATLPSICCHYSLRCR